jgi:hypothetical protein
MPKFTSKCWTDTSVLPPDILTLKGYDFFNVVEQLTSDSVADLLRVQEIQNVQVFMLVSNVLSVLQSHSSELDCIKNNVYFRLNDNNYILKIGIKASVRYLRELFACKINEHYYPNRKQEVEIDMIDYNTDTVASFNDSVTNGKKRPASFSSLQEPSSKRGRK